MSTHAAAGRHYEGHPGLAPFGTDPRRACHGKSTKLFFPEESDGAAAEAKRICRGCVFREPCKEWAVTAPEMHGYWGGTSASWRRDERLRRKHAARQDHDGESPVAA